MGNEALKQQAQLKLAKPRNRNYTQTVFDDYSSSHSFKKTRSSVTSSRNSISSVSDLQYKKKRSFRFSISSDSPVKNLESSHIEQACTTALVLADKIIKKSIENKLNSTFKADAEKKSSSSSPQKLYRSSTTIPKDTPKSIRGSLLDTRSKKEGDLRSSILSQSRGSVHISGDNSKSLRGSLVGSFFDDASSVKGSLLDNEINVDNLDQEEFSEFEKALEYLNTKLQEKNKISQNLMNLYPIHESKKSKISRVFDLTSRKFFALKEFKAAGDSQFKEIITLLRIIKDQNPKLIKIFKIEYSHKKACSILMEFCIGSLECYIKFRNQVKTSFNSSELKALQGMMLLQHDALRKLGIAHKGIKESKYVVSDEGFLKLVDFSSAEFCEPEFETPLDSGDRDIQDLNTSPREEDHHKSFEDIWESELVPMKEIIEKLKPQDFEYDFDCYVDPPYFPSEEESLVKCEDFFKYETRNKMLKLSVPDVSKLIELLENLSLIEDKGLMLEKEHSNTPGEHDEIIGHKYIFPRVFNCDFAIEVLSKHLEKVIQKFGFNNFQISNIYFHIGRMYLLKGACQPALDILDKAEKMFSSSEGHNQDLSSIWTQKGRIYERQGKYQEALVLYEKSLQRYLKAFGSRYLSTGHAYHDVGKMYLLLENFPKALENFKKALEIKTKLLGLNHTSLAVTYHDLGQVYRAQAEYALAVENCNHALHIELEKPDQNKKSIALIYHELGQISFLQAHYNKALEYYKRSLSIKNDLFERSNVSFAYSYHDIAQVYKNQGKLSEAVDYLEKSIKLYTDTYGLDHYEISSSYHALGQVKYLEGDFEKALEFYDKSLEIKKKFFGEKSLKVTIVYNDIAQIHIEQEKYEDSLALLKKSLEIEGEIIGLNHPSVATTYQGLGEAYLNLFDFDNALDNLVLGLQIKLKSLGESHLSVSTTLDLIGQVMFMQERYTEALEFFDRAMAIKFDYLELSHPGVEETFTNLLAILFDGDLDPAKFGLTDSFENYFKDYLKHALKHLKTERKTYEKLCKEPEKYFKFMIEYLYTFD